MFSTQTKTILFISGPFISHHCWQNWLDYFTDLGYKVAAPPWIYKNDTVENLRNNRTNYKIGSITLTELLCYYKEIIEILSEKPILIGHSYGGLIVQLLVSQDLASAAVCINSFPPSGLSRFNICFYKNILKFCWGAPFSLKTRTLSFNEWQNLFQNGNFSDDQSACYGKYYIPDSKRVFRNLIWQKARINFRKKHVPMLLISCSNDNIVPFKTVYWNFKKYRNVHAITCYKKFDNYNHLIVIDPLWNIAAEDISQWLGKVF